MRAHIAFLSAAFLLLATSPALAGKDIFVDMVFRNSGVFVEPHFRTGADLSRVPYPNARDGIIGDRAPALIDNIGPVLMHDSDFAPAFGPPSNPHRGLDRFYPATGADD
ncbi:MAG: hypothetical protein HQ511_07725 [Rhodospirillales bacterium]|nr:hypothetical protein [Rhodospirillales bacterium]